MSLYTELRDAGCTLDNHESDLYVLAEPKALFILKHHPLEWGNARTFTSDLDGKLWYDIPFAYDPFWERRK